MPTKGEIIDDIILRVTKGAPSDDLELEPRQVAFWFDLIASEIVPNYLNGKLKRGEGIPEDFIKIDDNLVPVAEDVTMLEDFDDRVYITLSRPIMALRNDAGLIRIITEEGSVVNKAHLHRLDTLNSLTFGRPTRENLLHTRVNDRIYIHGLSPRNVGIMQFSVYYIPKIDISSMNDTDELALPDEVMNLIADAIEEKAWKELNGIPDIENDAEDDNNVNG